MSILHIRNVPEGLYERLKQRAEAQHRSLSAEVISLLEWAVEEAEWRADQTLASIRQRRFYNPVSMGAPGSIRLLREDRER